MGGWGQAREPTRPAWDRRTRKQVDEDEATVSTLRQFAEGKLRDESRLSGDQRALYWDIVNVTVYVRLLEDALAAKVRPGGDPAEECRCGHPRSAHVYHEGPCRGGFVCLDHCDRFATA